MLFKLLMTTKLLFQKNVHPEHTHTLKLEGQMSAVKSYVSYEISIIINKLDSLSECWNNPINNLQNSKYIKYWDFPKKLILFKVNFSPKVKQEAVGDLRFRDLNLQLVWSHANTLSVLIFYLVWFEKIIWKSKTWAFIAHINEYILAIFKIQTPPQTLFYENFITALFSQLVLEYILKV